MKRKKKISEKKLHFAVVATDVATLSFVKNKLSVLCIDPTNPDYKDKPALVGGLIDPKETAEESVMRHLKNKAGIKPDYIKQLHTFSSLNRDTRGRVISIAYLALLKPSKVMRKNDAAFWVPINKVRNMAYDHSDIIKTAHKMLKSEIFISNIVCNLMPSEFSLTDLQYVYERILGKKIDKRNFRKKILSLGWLKETGKVQTGTHRPAKLYKFIPCK